MNRYHLFDCIQMEWSFLSPTMACRTLKQQQQKIALPLGFRFVDNKKS
jgi:hypothetical protein